MGNESSPSLAPQSLPQSNSIRKRSAEISNSSPEFEFWRIRNPSLPQPRLLSADELFSSGILLPLDLLPANQIHHEVADKPSPEPDSIERSISEISIPRSGPQEAEHDPGPSPDSQEPSTASIMAETAACAALTASKRWKDIFKKSEKKSSGEEKGKGKETKKEKKNGGVGGGNGGNGGAELNINIWPFSRSRSAGNNAGRPKTSAPATRKVSSAPCSRSNSAGESKSRKSWPSSPGVHLGRSSPVWQVRRAGSGGRSGSISSDSVAKKAEKNTKKESGRKRLVKDAASASGTAAVIGGGGNRVRVLNLNVPMCIGYRHRLSCRSDEASATGAGVGGSSGECGGQNDVDGGGLGGARNVGNLFTIRSLFAKKVY